MTKFEIGDRVRFSSKFCRSICAYTGFFPTARGTILSFWGKEKQHARIKWDYAFDCESDAPSGACLANLEKCR